MKRAEWTRRADDPMGSFGWWARGIAEKNLRYALLIPLFLLAPFAAVRFLLWPLFLVGTLAFALGYSERRCRRDRLAPLLPDPPPNGQFRAAVVYRRDGLITGQEEMALTPIEDWLIGEGVRSHFALRSSDVREPIRWIDRLDRQERLHLIDGSEIRLVGITYNLEVRTAVERWRRTESDDGESTFPPVRVHPQEVARKKAWTFGGLALAFGIRGAASWLHFWPREKDLVVAIMLAGLGVALVSCRKWGRLIAIDHAAERLAALPEQAPAEGGNLPFEETKVRT